MGRPVGRALTASLQRGKLHLGYIEAAQPDTMYGDWSVELGASTGQALQVGRYENAPSENAAGQAAGGPTLEYGWNGIVFAPFGSDFEILELEVDGNGAVSRLAVDFDVKGIGDYTPAQG